MEILGSASPYFANSTVRAARLKIVQVGEIE